VTGTEFHIKPLAETRAGRSSEGCRSVSSEGAGEEISKICDPTSVSVAATVAQRAQNPKVAGFLAPMTDVGQVVDVEALSAATVLAASSCPSESLPSLPLPGRTPQVGAVLRLASNPLLLFDSTQDENKDAERPHPPREMDSRNVCRRSKGHPSDVGRGSPELDSLVCPTRGVRTESQGGRSSSSPLRFRPSGGFRPRLSVLGFPIVNNDSDGKTVLATGWLAHLRANEPGSCRFAISRARHRLSASSSGCRCDQSSRCVSLPHSIATR
jgi:hypothetical protein